MYLVTLSCFLTLGAIFKGAWRWDEWSVECTDENEDWHLINCFLLKEKGSRESHIVVDPPTRSSPADTAFAATGHMLRDSTAQYYESHGEIFFSSFKTSNRVWQTGAVIVGANIMGSV